MITLPDIALALILGRAQLATAAACGWPVDPQDRGVIACPKMPANKLRFGFAHRTRECGAEAIICGRRCVRAWRVDSGPWGTLDRKGRWHARKHLRPGERWRGELDLRPELARAVGVRGVERVIVIWQEKEGG